MVSIVILIIIFMTISLNNFMATPDMVAPKPIEIVVEHTEGDTLVDKDGIIIRAMEYNSNSVPYSNIRLVLENFSGEDLIFCTKTLVIDGYMSDSTLYKRVINNSAGNTYIALNDAELERNGITEPRYFDIAFAIYDESGACVLETNTFNVKTRFYNEKEDAENTSDYDPDADTVIYDSNGIKFVAKKNITKDDFNNLNIPFYIENNSGTPIRICPAGNGIINGINEEFLFEEDVLPQKRANSIMRCWTDEINDLDATAVETIEISFIIKNTDTNVIIDRIDGVTIRYN